MGLNQPSSQNGPQRRLGPFGACVRLTFETPGTPSFGLEGQIPVQAMVAFAAQEAFLLFGTILPHVLTFLWDVIRYPIL